MINDAKHTDENSHRLYFIYYSGHGRLINGETCGIDKIGNNIKLEEFVLKISLNRNATVIAFLDCCRKEEVLDKGF